jgi:hypothetical protein
VQQPTLPRRCLQVFVSYGLQSNDSLMQFYGFAEAGNPADVYVMTRLLDWVGALQPVQPAALAALQEFGGHTLLRRHCLCIHADVAAEWGRGIWGC